MCRVGSGTPAVCVYRKLGITAQTFDRWRRKFGHLGVTEVRALEQLQDGNRRLKRRVVNLSFDTMIQREILRKKR